MKNIRQQGWLCRSFGGWEYHMRRVRWSREIVAVIDSGKPGKLLMLRADIDPLPIEETAQVLLSSLNKGVMHACGHDVHTANLLAVGKF